MIVREQNIFGLDIPMNELNIMRKLERFGSDWNLSKFR